MVVVVLDDDVVVVVVPETDFVIIRVKQQSRRTRSTLPTVFQRDL